MTNKPVGAFVRECQLFAGYVSSARVGTSPRALVDEFVSKLRIPDAPLEILAMDGLLFNVAARWSHGVHEQFHVDKGAAYCGFDPDADLVRSWRSRHASPITAFAEWATSFLDKIEQSHRPSATLRVKARIDRGSESRLSMKSLARETGCHTVRLRTDFKRDFGMSIREYQTRRRMLKAAYLLATSNLKVDAVARMAGFPNRKNFYDAFKRTLRTRPSAVRGWSEADFQSFEERLFEHVANDASL
jgi:AraC-like DNA-binding protein